MKMIYGSIAPKAATNLPALAEIEKQNVACMQAALAGYPWKAGSLFGLAGASGRGAFGVHTGDEMHASPLIPVLGDLTIAADARLDNRAELCAGLAISTVDQDNLEDAELILRAYQHWGDACATHLLGDFVFAIWDQAAERLFCARDFVGVRPFYYHYAPQSGSFMFASDLQALAAHPQVPLELNLAFFAATLQLQFGQFYHPGHTYLQAIEKLLPAQCLTLDAGGMRQWAYWQPGQVPERRYTDEREYVEELLPLLNAAVACRVGLPGSPQVGAHISGGLDSSSVAVLAHRILQAQGRSLTGFSWAPPLPENPADLPPIDERHLVEAVRQAEGFCVRYTSLTPAHILAHARRNIPLQPTTTLLYELASSANAASMGIRTMLTGWGGDELLAFNGRGYFSDLLRRGRWQTLQRELTLRAQLNGGSTIWKQWILDGLLPLFPLDFRRFLRPADYPRPEPPPSYLCPDFATALAGVTPLSNVEIHVRPGVRRMQIAVLQHGHLSYRMESWASHGASLGLAYAFPLLDRRLVEFALSIPDFLFFKNGWKRYLYRTAMAGILPDRLRWQKMKEDPATAIGARKPRLEAAGQLRADLLARADNPIIDIDQLLLALANEEGFRNTLAQDNLSREDRRRLLLQLKAERAIWLAFVDTSKNRVVLP